jgi:hypothetical protein
MVRGRCQRGFQRKYNDTTSINVYSILTYLSKKVINTNEVLVYWQIKTKVRESISKALDKAEESLLKGEIISAEKKRVMTTVRGKMRLVDNLKRKSETFEMVSQEVINLNRAESYSLAAINLSYLLINIG